MRLIYRDTRSLDYSSHETSALDRLLYSVALLVSP